MLLRKNGVVIFQGDSITDAGRTGPKGTELGQGYPAMCAGAMQALLPDYNLKVYNRGVGGNRVPDMADRWRRDTMDLHPSLVSILIGVNDVWHSYAKPGVEFDIAKIEDDYERIVRQTLNYGSKLVIMEPYAFHHDVFPESWRERLWQVQQVVRRIALRYADAYIPLDGMFYRATVSADASKLSPSKLSVDGVHPTAEGHRLIARAWLKAVGVV